MEIINMTSEDIGNLKKLSLNFFKFAGISKYISLIYFATSTSSSPIKELILLLL